MGKTKKKKYWTEDEVNLLRELTLSGHTLNQIALIMNRSPFAVILRLRQLSGLELPYPADKVPDEYFDESLTMQQVYPERFQKWSDMDNERLMREFDMGENIFNLSKTFHRTPLAIILHIQDLSPTQRDMNKLFDRAKLLLGKRKVTKTEAPKAVTEEEMEAPKAVPEEEITEVPTTDTESTEQASRYKCYIDEQKAQYENYGKPWKKDDDNLLKVLYDEKQCTIDLIMQVFRRNRGGIISRLRLLGFEVEE